MSQLRHLLGTGRAERSTGITGRFPELDLRTLVVGRDVASRRDVAEAARLLQANEALRNALIDLIQFAGDRTAIFNECGDKILDPRVLNARAVLAAVDAEL